MTRGTRQDKAYDVLGEPETASGEQEEVIAMATQFRLG